MRPVVGHDHVAAGIAYFRKGREFVRARREPPELRGRRYLAGLLDGTPNPQLYPQASVNFTVLVAGILLFGIVGMLVSTVTSSSFVERQDPRVIGGVFLSCFFLVLACVAVASQKRNARWSRGLVEFAATSRERLLATLETFNPAARPKENGACSD